MLGVTARLELLVKVALAVSWGLQRLERVLAEILVREGLFDDEIRGAPVSTVGFFAPLLGGIFFR